MRTAAFGNFVWPKLSKPFGRPAGGIQAALGVAIERRQDFFNRLLVPICHYFFCFYGAFHQA